MYIFETLFVSDNLYISDGLAVVNINNTFVLHMMFV